MAKKKRTSKTTKAEPPQASPPPAGKGSTLKEAIESLPDVPAPKLENPDRNQIASTETPWVTRDGKMNWTPKHLCEEKTPQPLRPVVASQPAAKPSPGQIVALIRGTRRLADMIDVCGLGSSDNWALSVSRLHTEVQAAALEVQDALVPLPPVKRSTEGLCLRDLALSVVDCTQDMFGSKADPKEIAERLRGLATELEKETTEIQRQADEPQKLWENSVDPRSRDGSPAVEGLQIEDDAFTILCALADSPTYLKQEELACGEKRMSRRTVSRHLGQLSEYGFVEYNPRNKKGARITDIGRQYLSHRR